MGLWSRYVTFFLIPTAERSIVITMRELEGQSASLGDNPTTGSLVRRAVRPFNRKRWMFTLAALGLVAPTLAGCAASTDGSATTRAAQAPSAATFQSDWGDQHGSGSTYDPSRTLRSEVASAIGATAAYKRGITGAGVDVALIDTGVAPVAGLDAAGTVVNGPDLSLDHQAGLPTAVDAYGHGTHLAGIIAGRDGGIAPGARIVNVKVGAADGAVDVSQVIAGIDWVVQHRNDPGLNIKVLALAYGTDSTQSYYTSPLTHAVESAWRNGITVVVSAGNTAGPLVNPATDPFVITVGASDINNPSYRSDDVLAPFSALASSARPVDVVAPGTSIVSSRVPGSMVDTLYPESRTTDGFTKGSGTSQAAAVVAGSAALLISQRPALTPNQVKKLLRNSGHSLSSTSGNAQGKGSIDVSDAISADMPDSSTQYAFRSVGTGTIEAARGSAHLVADDGTQLTGEVDIQGAPWTPSTWAPASTAGTTWTGGSWNGNEWAGDTWADSYTVDNVTWSGRTWRSSTWSGRTWRADLWAGRTWRSELWEGRTWRADGWD